MAVSKRLRYEILHRDNHTCRYCGATAPDAKLVVDHVLPEALGGLTAPENLVTACEPCNSGKASTTPSAATVADVADDAFRWTQAVAVASQQMLADQRLIDQSMTVFKQRWNEFGSSTLPPAWRDSVERFLAAGLPMEVLLGCVDKAMVARNVPAADTFRYMCGIAWKKIRQLQEAARTPMGAVPIPPPPGPSDVELLADRILEAITHPADRYVMLGEAAEHECDEDDEPCYCQGNGGGAYRADVIAASRVLAEYPPGWFDLTEEVKNLIRFIPDRTVQDLVEAEKVRFASMYDLPAPLNSFDTNYAVLPLRLLALMLRPLKDSFIVAYLASVPDHDREGWEQVMNDQWPRLGRSKRLEVIAGYIANGHTPADVASGRF